MRTIADNSIILSSEDGKAVFSDEEKERAIAILKQCDGLSVDRARSLLNRCGEALLVWVPIEARFEENS